MLDAVPYHEPSYPYYKGGGDSITPFYTIELEPLVLSAAILYREVGKHE